MTMSTRAVLIVSALLAACSTSPLAPAPAICELRQLGCGGDLVGAWKLTPRSCFTLAPEGALTFDGEDTLTFASDGGWSAVGSGNGFSIVVGADAGADAGSCAALSASAAQRGGACTGADAPCTCTYPSTAIDETGAYTTDGGRLTRSLGPPGPYAILQTEEYCVDGSALHVTARFGNFEVFGRFERASQ